MKNELQKLDWETTTSSGKRRTDCQVSGRFSTNVPISFGDERPLILGVEYLIKCPIPQGLKLVGDSDSSTLNKTVWHAN